MYRDRDWNLVTISSDEMNNKDKALSFLLKKQASGTNYIYTGQSKYKMIEAIDPKWQGALPFSVLVELRGGKIIYAKEGKINMDTLKEGDI